MLVPSLSPWDQQHSRMMSQYLPGFLNSVLTLESGGKTVMCVPGYCSWSHVSKESRICAFSEFWGHLPGFPPVGRNPGAYGSSFPTPELRIHFLALLALVYPYRVTMVAFGFGSSSVHSLLSDDFGPVAPLSGLHPPPWTRPVVTQVSACFMGY